LNNLQNPEPIDWANYKDPGESSYTRPPVPVDKDNKRIVFEGVLPPGFTYKANNGILLVTVDPIQIKGMGYKIRFTTVSAKNFVRDNGTSSSFLANFVRAVDKTARPQTAQDYIRVVDGFARKTFKFTADWEAYDKESGTTICKGYANFPLDEKVNDGFTRVPWIEVGEGNGKRRVFANLKIANYIAQGK
jgi:hypothetical protein